MLLSRYALYNFRSWETSVPGTEYLQAVHRPSCINCSLCKLQRAGTHLRVPCTTPESRAESLPPLPQPNTIKHSIDLNRLNEHVSHTIMADQHKAETSLTSKELLAKSNPGLLGTGADLTNPRNWYNSASAEKLLNDFITQYDNVENGGNEEGMTKKVATVYVALPSKSSGKQTNMNKVRKMSNASSNGLENFLVTGETVGRHSGSHLKHKENQELNLPELAVTDRSSKGSNGIHEKHTHIDEDLVLPKLSRRSITFEELPTPVGIENVNKAKTIFSSDDNQTQLDSWFSKMPAEALLQAEQQRLKQESDISKGLQHLPFTPRVLITHVHINNLHKHGGNLKPHPVSSRASSLSEKFEELLLPKHRSDENHFRQFREQYGLRQKSVLNLKLDSFEQRQKKKRLPPMKDKSKVLRHSLSYDFQTNGHGSTLKCEGSDTTEIGDLMISAFKPQANSINGDTASVRSQDRPAKFVYKASSEGFLLKSLRRESTKTSVINLHDVKASSPITGQSALSSVSVPPESTHGKESPAGKQDTNSYLSARRGSLDSDIKMRKTHSLNSINSLPGIKEKGVLKRFKKLDIFGENDLSLPVNDSDILVIPKSPESPREYLPVARQPSYKLDPLILKSNGEVSSVRNDSDMENTIETIDGPIWR